MHRKKFLGQIIAATVSLISTHSIAMEVKKTRTVSVQIMESGGNYWSELLPDVQLRESKLKNLNVRQYVVNKALKEAAKIGPVPAYSSSLLTTENFIVQKYLIDDNPPKRRALLMVALTSAKKRH